METNQKRTIGDEIWSTKNFDKIGKIALVICVFATIALRQLSLNQFIIFPVLLLLWAHSFFLLMVKMHGSNMLFFPFLILIGSAVNICVNVPTLMIISEKYNVISISFWAIIIVFQFMQWEESISFTKLKNEKKA